MKKTISISAVASLFIILSLLAFKPADNSKKEYLTISQSTNGKEIHLSYSNGTYKKIECEKPKDFGDQTQILKYIVEQEALGYSLVSYEYSSEAANHRTNAILSK